MKDPGERRTVLEFFFQLLLMFTVPYGIVLVGLYLLARASK